MSDYTLFLSAVASVWPDNVNDPSYSAQPFSFSKQISSGINYQKVEDIEIDNGETRAISLSNHLFSAQDILCLSVVGSVRVETVAQDGAFAPITGAIPVYGTAKLPGKLMLSTYNVTSYTLRGLSDNSKVDLYLATCGA